MIQTEQKSKSFLFFYYSKADDKVINNDNNIFIEKGIYLIYL